MMMLKDGNATEHDLKELEKKIETVINKHKEEAQLK